MEDYIPLLDDKEAEYIGTLIGGKNIRHLFQKYPSEFAKIRPGFRPNAISDADAVGLATRFRDRTFISSWLTKWINKWLEDIHVYQADLIQKGSPEQDALILTLADSLFAENIDLYFKLIRSEYTFGHIQAIKFAVKKLREKPDQEAASMDKPNLQSEAAREQDSKEERQWKAAEEAYQQKIESMNALVDASRQELINAQGKVADAQSEISTLRSELAKYHKLSAHAVNSGELFRDEQYQYTSLCKVVADYEGKPRLKRLSDVLDGTIIGGDLGDAPRRSWLYMRDGPAVEGFIGLWDWAVVPNDRDSTKDFILSAYSDKYIPTEVIQLSDCQSIDDVINNLNIGIETTSAPSRVLFAYWNGMVYEGLFCTSKALNTMNGRTRLRDSAYALPVFQFRPSDLFSTEGRSFHCQINIGTPQRLAYVKDPLEIVKDILIQRVTAIVTQKENFSRNERHELRDLLKELPATDLYQEISTACECDVEEASELASRLIQQADSYLSGSDLDEKMLAEIVHTHDSILKACQEAIRDEWTKENKMQVAEANVTLDTLNRKAAEQKANTEEMKKEYVAAQTKLNETMTKLAQREKLAADVEEKVASRIAQAQKEAADFIANQAFCTTAQVPQISESFSSFSEGSALPADNLEPSRYQKELQSAIRCELLEAGVSEKYSTGLAAWLYGAFVNHVPLLLCGPCGHEIADAFSAAVFGCLSATLNCDGAYSAEFVEKCDTAASMVVTIESPFSSAWWPHLPAILTTGNKSFIAVTPYAEDLQIEPQGLFNYLLPVMTELFVDKLPRCNFTGGYLSDDFEEYQSNKAKPLYDEFFKNARLSLLARNRLQQMLADLHTITEDSSTDLDCLFALLPCAWISGRPALLSEVVHKNGQSGITVSADVLSQISGYIGETE